MRLDLTARRETVAMRSPLPTAFGQVAERELVAVTLRDADGAEGRGEAAPLQAYDGIPIEAVETALGRYAEILRDAPSELNGMQLLDRCRDAIDLPQALAAVDLAIWDRAGRRADRAVWELLTDEALERVPVNATIGALDRAGAAAAAAQAAREGFACVKVKVGMGDDAARVAAVRAAAGPHMALRLDANGAWDVDEAVRWIDVLSPAGLELVEEPVHGIAALRAVRERVATRVAIDETASIPGSLAAGVADAVCLKIARCGGIAALLSQAALVRAYGGEVYLASTYDGPLGIAAAVHAAAALRVELPCGLATLGDLELEAPSALHVADGMIAVPDGPGLL